MEKKLYKELVKVVKATMDVVSLDEAKAYIIDKGLTTQNKKLQKGANYNVGVSLLPASLSGQNLCKGAGDCKYTCLAFSGAGCQITYKRIYDGRLPAPIMSMLYRTKLLLEDRPFFEKVLRYEIEMGKFKAELHEMIFAVRLNVTSDVDWSDFASTMPEVQFYDYTKVLNRKSTANYHVTYSASELTTEKNIFSLLKKGNVAMVFKKVPTEWNGVKVIDGDQNDNRYEDEKGKRIP
jgi:hypothetical protein